MSPAVATPSINNCGAADAPATHAGLACNSMCSSQAAGGGFIVKCDMTAASCEGLAQDFTKAVHDYSGAPGPDFSAWGDCTVSGTTTSWCCIIDDNGVGSAEIWEFLIKGSPSPMSRSPSTKG